MPYGYYNYGQNPYYAPPMPDQLAQLRGAQTPPPVNTQQLQPITPPQSSSGIIWVQGEEGAKAYMVAPGNTVLLMDSDGSSFYLKTVDNSGMPQPLRTFDYSERTTAPKTPLNGVQNSGVEYVTRDEFNALAAEIEALRAKKCNCRTKATDKNTTSDDEKE